MTKHRFEVKTVKNMKLDTHGHIYQLLSYIRHVNPK